MGLSNWPTSRVENSRCPGCVHSIWKQIDKTLDIKSSSSDLVRDESRVKVQRIWDCMGVCYPSRSIANLHESTSYEAEMMDRHIEIDLRIGQKQADCCVLSLLGLIENLSQWYVERTAREKKEINVRLRPKKKDTTIASSSVRFLPFFFVM